MIKTFIIHLLSLSGKAATRVIPTHNIVSANYIANAIWGNTWKILSITEQK